jgi:hypothetical protein
MGSYSRNRVEMDEVKAGDKLVVDVGQDYEVWVKVLQNAKVDTNVGTISIKRRVGCISKTGRIVFLEKVKSTDRERLRYAGSPAANIEKIERNNKATAKFPNDA